MAARSRSGALIAGVVLMGIGIVFMLENWHLGFSFWRVFAHCWPLLLIFVGLKKLYGHLTWQEAPPIPPQVPPPPPEPPAQGV